MIDINKKYKTRGGHQVRIYATDGGQDQGRVHGAAKFSNGWFPMSWNSDGSHYSDGDSMYDLVEVSEYRPAEFPRDYGKECQFSDDRDFTEPIISTLRGYFPNLRYRWMTEGKNSFQYARVKNED